MTQPLAVVEHAGYATVQDGGRRGLSRVGVPVSGPFHRQRYLVATALLSGDPDPERPAIEVLAGDLRLVMRADSLVAVVGPASMHVDGHPAATGTALLVHEGAAVRVEPIGAGPSYLVIAGWVAPRVLGSAATDTFSKLGGGLLGAGSLLAGAPDPAEWSRVGAFHRRLSSATGPLRAAAAGHPAIADLTAASWTVASIARSGVRMTGPVLPVEGSVASMPVVAGAIQATPGGEVIVLGPDGGLTGGYPVVGVVTSADLDRLSLLAVGDPVTFRETGVDEAHRAWRERERDLMAAVTHPDQLP